MSEGHSTKTRPKPILNQNIKPLKNILESFNHLKDQHS
jgi:hypothetical protein